MKNIKKPIIISGIPRSGTTPLGIVLSSIKGFSMIYEPFNANQGIIDVQFNYPYPGKNISVEEFQSIFNNLVQFKSSFKKGYLKHDSLAKRLYLFNLLAVMFLLENFLWWLQLICL